MYHTYKLLRVHISKFFNRVWYNRQVFCSLLLTCCVSSRNSLRSQLSTQYCTMHLWLIARIADRIIPGRTKTSDRSLSRVSRKHRTISSPPPRVFPSSCYLSIISARISFSFSFSIVLAVIYLTCATCSNYSADCQK